MKMVIGIMMAGLLAACAELPPLTDFSGSGVRSTERHEPTRQQQLQKSIERRAP